MAHVGLSALDGWKPIVTVMILHGKITEAWFFIETYAERHDNNEELYINILKHDQTSLIKIISLSPGCSPEMLTLADAPLQHDPVRLDNVPIWAIR